MNLYSIYNKVSKTYFAPFFAENTAVAVQIFLSQYSSDASLCDYQIWYHGFFDKVLGRITFTGFTGNVYDADRSAIEAALAMQDDED